MVFKRDTIKCKPIIVKFSRYNVCDKVLKIENKLKGKGYSITERLTALKMKKLTEARNRFGFTNFCTQNGKILCNEDNKIKVFFDLLCIRRVIRRCAATRRCFLKIAYSSYFLYKDRKLTTLVESFRNACWKFRFSS